MNTFWGSFHVKAGRAVATQRAHAAAGLVSSSHHPSVSVSSGLQGKRVGMVTFSSYPADPRPRRAAEALLKEGMRVDLVCLRDKREPTREAFGGINILRVPITHRRGGRFSYAHKYSAFILISAGILALRSLKHRYDLIYVHNMPDILVLSSLLPKALGAKVILDQHDPMPELMMTIFNLDKKNRSVRLLSQLEKWSTARADLVVMNSPDGEIFPFRPARLNPCRNQAPTKPFVIMYHGSLVERNGLDLVVDALARVRKDVPAAEIRIYGRKTPFLERVMDQARNKDLADRVHYLGPRRQEDLVGEIENCDVGVIPNHRNAFTDINTPTRIFEYLALGKPVIAPATLGILDYFTEDSLLFVEPGNSADIARQIEYVARNYQDAIRVAERGQQIYLQHTWKQERRTLVELVSGLLSKGEA